MSNTIMEEMNKHLHRCGSRVKVVEVKACPGIKNPHNIYKVQLIDPFIEVEGQSLNLRDKFYTALESFAKQQERVIWYNNTRSTFWVNEKKEVVE